MSPRLLYHVIVPLLWLAGAGLLSWTIMHARPLLPGSELQSLAVAWGMWRDGYFLIPQLHGETYGQSLPLVIWLYQAGWGLFGVNDWWPKIIGPLFGLGNVFMIVALCRMMWPGRVGVGAVVGTLLFGSIAWLFISSLSLDVAVVSFCVLAALYGIIETWLSGKWGGILLYALMVGIAMLAKGPLVLAYILPIALLAPIWGWAMIDDLNAEAAGGTGSPDEASPTVGVGGWRRWYMQLLCGTILALLPMVAWLSFITVEQGDGYLLGLLKGALFRDPAHLVHLDVSWWWVVLGLSMTLLPWLLWPTVWRSAREALVLVKSGSGRFCLLWLICILVSCFALPGQFAGYGILVLPPLVLMVTFMLYSRAARESKGELSEPPTAQGEALIGIVVAVLGFAMLVLPLAAKAMGTDSLQASLWWLASLWGYGGVLLIIVGGVVAWTLPKPLVLRALCLSGVSLALVISTLFCVQPLLRDHFDASAASARVKILQERGVPVAFISPYQGQFDFSARLESDLHVLEREDPIGVLSWSGNEVGAEIIALSDKPAKNVNALLEVPYGDKYLIFWPAAYVADHPGILGF